ncbi:hypothetical protein [Paractinoplanes durhamensis]|uniref:Uncharacterized protein n=1 Tax=Paractinoplanes durhamensis TaxID=113563 RepID=A0ABQ3Z6S8_9ACTN|nr:hypothetical protein [Actinoplanes durhamensis]GIE05521.1 hypothetical protein Adu01nite_68710 [Actinoplanes durhamensis]
MKPNPEFNPIVGITILPTFWATMAIASPDAHTASVFVSVVEGSEEAATGSGTAPTLRQRLRRRYWQYELDLTHHPVVLRFSLPAKEEAYAFTAIVTLLWAVQNPIQVALLGVRDLKPILWTFLEQTLRGVSRQFGIEEVQAAEAEMRLILDKHAGEIGFGLRLPMLAVSLRLDEDTERYLSQRVQTGRAGNLADDRHDLARQEAENEERQAEWRSHLEQAQAEWQGRLEQVQAEWRGRLEQAQALHRRDLDAAQADHAREIERLNAEHETKLKAQRLDFYRDALGGGNHDVMVLQLIENPGDIGAVLRLIEAGNDKHYVRSREILDNLLQHHLANAADVDGLTQHTIGELRTALSAAAPRSSVVIEEGVSERVREKHTDRIIRQTAM